jgi:hypothetical protein
MQSTSRHHPRQSNFDETCSDCVHLRLSDLAPNRLFLLEGHDDRPSKKSADGGSGRGRRKWCGARGIRWHSTGGGANWNAESCPRPSLGRISAIPTNCGRPGFSPATLASMDRRTDMHASPIWRRARCARSVFTILSAVVALTVEVGLHLGKPLDDGLDPVPEPRTGQVPVNHFHLGLLAFSGTTGASRSAPRATTTAPSRTTTRRSAGTNATNGLN